MSLQKGEIGHKDMHTERKLYEDEERDQGVTSTNKGMSKIDSKLPDARETHGTDCPSHPSEETSPANSLSSDLQPPQV